MLLKDLDVNYGIREKKNYIFCASEGNTRQVGTHFAKMNELQSVVTQLEGSLRNSRVLRFDDYAGETVDAASIGIVFPAHSWGVSLAVIAFLQHLCFSPSTYIYAVAVGESVASESQSSVKRGLAPLKQFEEVFGRRTRGVEADLYVRCRDMKRSFDTIEGRLKSDHQIKNAPEVVLEGMCYTSTGKLLDKNYVEQRRLSVSLAEAEAMYESINMRSRRLTPSAAHAKAPGVEKPTSRDGRVHMENIFLDDSVFSEVRLRVI